jgi:hypothetical protein
VIQYGVIVDSGSKPVSIVIHDPSSSRLVFKGPPRSELQTSFEFAVDRPVVILEAKGRSQVRRKLQPSQREYLRALLDRCIHAPYKVRSIEEIHGSHRIDSLADKLEKEILS